MSAMVTVSLVTNLVVPLHEFKLGKQNSFGAWLKKLNYELIRFDSYELK